MHSTKSYIFGKGPNHFKPLSNEKNATVWKGEVNAAYGDRVSLPSRLP